MADIQGKYPGWVRPYSLFNIPTILLWILKIMIKFDTLDQSTRVLLSQNFEN